MEISGKYKQVFVVLLFIIVSVAIVAALGLTGVPNGPITIAET